MPALTNKSIAPTAIHTAYCKAGNGAIGSLNSDAPTNTVKLTEGVANGSRITKITGRPKATSTASVVYLFRSKDGGTTKRVIASVNVTAWTASTTTGPTTAQAVDFGFSETSPVYLEDADDELYVGFAVTQGADLWDFNAEGGDYLAA
jgi:hypothetical protein